MRLPIAGMIMIAIAGICFFLFISFNYAFHGDGGLKETLWESANKSLTGDRKTTFDNLMPQLTQGFGIASVLLFGMAIVYFILDAMRDPPGGMT